MKLINKNAYKLNMYTMAMFRNFQMNSMMCSEKFTAILKDPNASFEDVLQEDEFFQELKSSNQDLINLYGI